MAVTPIEYDAVMRIYDEKRAAAAALLEERREAVYAQLPELKELEDNIASLSLREARARLSDERDSLDPSYASQMKALSDSASKCLLDAGYPEDYLEMPYECVDCRDTGYSNGTYCRCFRQTVVNLLTERTGLAEILKTENFASFDENYYPDRTDPQTGENPRALARQALQASLDFTAHFDDACGNLFFYGKPGVGKTFLTHCIADALLKTSHSVLYLTAHELFETLAGARFGETSGAAFLADSVLSCDLLIIDDLGTELTNTFVASELFTCLNERMLRRRSTVISTNLSLNEIEKLYSERVSSRILSDYTILHLTGADIRIIKKLRNR